VNEARAGSRPDFQQILDDRQVLAKERRLLYLIGGVVDITSSVEDQIWPKS